MSKLTKEQRDSLGTPQYLFNYAKTLTNKGQFDIDLCASDKNALCPDFYSVNNSALDQCWHNYHTTGFCNPPYSNITPFINFAIDEARSGFESVFLIPTPNGEKIYETIFAHAERIELITGRIAFLHPITGKAVSGIARGSCLVLFNKWSHSNFPPIIKMRNRDDLIRDYS